MCSVEAFKRGDEHGVLDPHSSESLGDLAAAIAGHELTNLTGTPVNLGAFKVSNIDEARDQWSHKFAPFVASDGQAWSGDVAKALVNARQRNTPVYVVGVGTTVAVSFPTPRSSRGRPSPFAPFSIALRCNRSRAPVPGEYFELDRETDRDIAAKIITSVKRNAGTSQQVESYEELYWRFL